MNEYEQNIEVMKDLRNRIDAVLKDRPNDIGAALTEPLGIPDPVKHKYVSFAKSVFRIGAGFAIAYAGYTEMSPYVQAGGLLLVLAEILGIVEELV